MYDETAVTTQYPGLRGHVVEAPAYKSGSRPKGTDDVDVVGLTNFNGRLAMDYHKDLKTAISSAHGLSTLACLPQILVVRPGLKMVIVCDWYRLANGDERQNIAIFAGDIVVATENYPESVSCAAEWAPIERFISGSLNREGLVQSLTRRRPPPK